MSIIDAVGALATVYFAMWSLWWLTCRLPVIPVGMGRRVTVSYAFGFWRGGWS